MIRSAIRQTSTNDSLLEYGDRNCIFKSNTPEYFDRKYDIEIIYAVT